MNRFPFTFTGVAHSWVCPRNSGREKIKRLLYDEIELSGRLMNHGSVYGVLVWGE